MGQSDKKRRGFRPNRRLPIQGLESTLLLPLDQQESTLRHHPSHHRKPPPLVYGSASVARANPLPDCDDSDSDSMVETRRSADSNRRVSSLRTNGNSLTNSDLKAFSRRNNVQTKIPDDHSPAVVIVDNDENSTASFSRSSKQQHIRRRSNNTFNDDDKTIPAYDDDVVILPNNDQQQRPTSTKRFEDTVSASSSSSSLQVQKSPVHTTSTPDASTTVRIRRGCSCANCLKENCGVCINCLGKVKFGGDGKNHQRCCERFCLVSQHSNKSMVKRISKHTGAAYFTTYLGPEAKQKYKQSTTTIVDTTPSTSSNALNEPVNHKQKESFENRSHRKKGRNNTQHNVESSSTSGSSTSSDAVLPNSSDSDDVIIAHLKRMATANVDENEDNSIFSSSSSRVHITRTKASKKRARDESSTFEVDIIDSSEETNRRSRLLHVESVPQSSTATGRRQAANTIEHSSAEPTFFVRQRLRERVPDGGTGAVASTSTNNMSSSYYREQHHTQRAHRVRCKECIACQRPVCGLCYSCLSRKSFGGDGKTRQSRDPCLFRRCHVIYPPSNERIDSFDDAHVLRNTNFFLDNFYTMFCHKPRSDVEEIFAFNRYLLKRAADYKSGQQPIEDLLRMLQQQKQKGQKSYKRKSNELYASKSSMHITVLPSMGSTSSKQHQHQQIQKKKQRQPSNDAVKKQQPQLSHQQQKQRQQLSEQRQELEEESNSLFLSTVMNAIPKDTRKPSSCVTRKKVLSNGEESSFQASATCLTSRLGTEPTSSSFYSSIIQDMLSGEQFDPNKSDKFVATKVVYDSAYKRSLSSLFSGVGHTKNKVLTEECLYGIPIESDPGTNSICAGCRGANDNDDDASDIKKPKGRKKTKGSKYDTGDETGSEISSKADDSISSRATVDSGIKNAQHTSSQTMEASTVLLCDGHKCGREYHLGCCIPSLTEVPNVDRWLCIDCSPDNMTASLTKYLESFDETRASFYFQAMEQRQGGGLAFSEKKKSSNRKGSSSISSATVPSYVYHLIQKDIAESGLPTTCDVPVSELERYARTNYLAFLDLSKATQQQSMQDEGYKSATAVPPFYEPPMVDQFLGKPIRIYDALSNRYQTGRIVDFREATTPEATNRNKQSTITQSRQPQGRDLRYQDTEFLIRFAAGKDERKSTYYHWLILEEHSLAVGMTVVWAKLQRTKTWKPSIIWYRTTRELIPVQHLLDGDKGEIYFQSHESLNQVYTQSDLSGRSRGRHFTNKPSKKMKRKAVSLIRTFGSAEEYGLVDAKQYAVDLMNDDATTNHKTPEMVLSYEIALAELKEQSRVRDWWHSINRNGTSGVGNMACSGLSSKDYYRLPSLIPRTNYIPDLKYSHRFGEAQGRTRHGARALCPNVQLGLDRKLILQLIRAKDDHQSEKIGDTFTVDDITNIVCDVVPAQR